MVKPREKYPRETYVIAEKIQKLKNKGLKYNDIPLNERPYDAEKLKEEFIKEVVLYNPSYLAKPKVTNYYNHSSRAYSACLYYFSLPAKRLRFGYIRRTVFHRRSPSRVQKRISSLCRCTRRTN